MPKQRGREGRDLENNRILSLEETMSWREGINGNHEEIKVLTDTIIALYSKINQLEQEYECCAFALTWSIDKCVF